MTGTTGCDAFFLATLLVLKMVAFQVYINLANVRKGVMMNISGKTFSSHLMKATNWLKNANINVISSRSMSPMSVLKLLHRLSRVWCIL